MKRIICSIAVSTAFLLTGLSVSAEEETTWGTVKQLSDDDPEALAPAAKGVVKEDVLVAPRYFDFLVALNLFTLIDGILFDEVLGATSELHRHKNGVNIKIDIPVTSRPVTIQDNAPPNDEFDLQKGVVPGYVYTLWVPVFDVPDECSPLVPDGPPDCGPDDMGLTGDGVNEDAEPTILGPVWGGIAGANGLQISGHIKKGYVYDEIDGPGINDRALHNPMTASIHWVLRCHGPKRPGDIVTQMKTGEFNCAIPDCDDIMDGIFAHPTEE